MRGTEGARVAVEWAPAAGVPEGCAAPDEAVEFSPGDLPVLREAGARYLRAEPSVPVRLTGAVVRMHRSQPRGEGTVRLAGDRGAEVQHVRMTLDEEAYRRPRPSGGAAGAGAPGAAGEPRRLPQTDLAMPPVSDPCRWTRPSGTG